MDNEPVPGRRPLSVAELAGVLRSYRRTIGRALAAVALVYLVVVAAVQLVSPAAVIASQPFRLEFDGSVDGKYPNGTRFSPAEIVNVPILSKVYAANELERFLPFEDFTRALYVVEFNEGAERLSRDYAARLADPKLSTVDRERIVREYESRRASISKNEYSLSFTTPRHVLPQELVAKILGEVLREWASHAAREQRVLQYQSMVLSPRTIRSGPETLHPTGRVQVLRASIQRALRNLDELEQLPGAGMARTREDGSTLHDVRVRLEDLVRFRLEPLAIAVHDSGLVPSADAMRFAETQLAHDERALVAARAEASLIRDALATYTRTAGDAPVPAATGDAVGPRGASPTSDGVSPQLTESFLERLLSLTRASGDVEYRQHLIEEYRRAAARVVPLEQEVAYHRDLLARRPVAGGTPISTAQVAAEMRRLEEEARDAVEQMNELYATISVNLQPATHMFVATGAPSARTHRATSWLRVALTGLLAVLLSLPLVVGGVLFHYRLRQEEAVGARATSPA